jgi:hypothetical protein
VHIVRDEVFPFDPFYSTPEPCSFNLLHSCSRINKTCPS